MRHSKKVIRVGVVGYGYWGPNIVRNLQSLPEARVVTMCDKNPRVLAGIRQRFDAMDTCSDYRDVTASADVDAVAVVTPVSTHFEIVRSALMNGKHVFVEKPFTASVREAEALIRLAEKKRLQIMVDHTFIFTGAVRKIKELVDDRTLGDLYYYDSMRVNLGLFQHDINVIWDLIPHDLAIMDYVIKNKPVAVSAHGVDHLGRGRENIAYVTVYFNTNTIAHFNVNWLSPVKVRSTLIGGSKKMLVWNDLEADESVKLYDRGVKVRDKEGVYRLLVDYRSGDMWAPKLDHTEALKMELEYFIRQIRTGRLGMNDAHAGLRVVKMLEATDRSLRQKGKWIPLRS